MDSIDLSSLQSELRGITACAKNSQYDHLSEISALIAAAQEAIKCPAQQKEEHGLLRAIESSH